MRLAREDRDRNPGYLLLTEGLLWCARCFFPIRLVVLFIYLRISQVEVLFALGNHDWFTEEQASDAFVDVELLAQVLCDVPLEHKLVILLSKVFQHSLVCASVDLWQFGNFLSFGLLRDRLV